MPVEISFVRFTHANIQAVADHLGVTATEVYDFLNDTERRNAKIERAFHYCTGMYPVRGFGPRPNPWWERLDFISDEPES